MSSGSLGEQEIVTQNTSSRRIFADIYNNAIFTNKRSELITRKVHSITSKFSAVSKFFNCSFFTKSGKENYWGRQSCWRKASERYFNISKQCYQMLANENIEICLHEKAARIFHRSTQEFFKTPGFFSGSVAVKNYENSSPDILWSFLNWLPSGDRRWKKKESWKRKCNQKPHLLLLCTI